jgi:catechol-2,3-dioxygenase
MSAKRKLWLSHVGLFVTDIHRMVDFYSRFMGFTITDRGVRPDGEIVFMTRDESEHHQLVFASGRPRDLGFNIINQLSFRLDGLDTLREMHAALKDEPVQLLGPITHGNALSSYFLDPEGNRVELLIGTPWYVPQPCRIPVDLSLPDDELWASIERQLSRLPGFMSREAWTEDIRRKLATA